MEVKIRSIGQALIGNTINVTQEPGRRNNAFVGERDDTPANPEAMDSSLDADRAAAEDPGPDLPTPTPVAEETQPQPSADDYRSVGGQNSLRVDGLDQGSSDPTAMESLKLSASDARRRSDDLSIEHPQRDDPMDCTEQKVLATSNPRTLQHGLGSSSSLTIDGGEDPVTGNSVVVSSLKGDDTQNIYAVHHKSFLLHNNDRDVYSISSKSYEDVLKGASTSGCFDDGVTPLLQLDWHGFMNFYLTKWKLTLKSGASGSRHLKDLTKQLCRTIQAWDIQCVRNVLEQLHHVHAAFLCSLFWDGGLTIFLGHSDQEKRPDFFQSPIKDQVQTILLQLLPEWCLDVLAWEMPTVYDEEEKEDGGQSPHVDVKSGAISGTSGDISGTSGDGSSTIKAPYFPQGQLLSSESSFQGRASSCESYSSGSDLSQILERVIEDKVQGCLTLKQEPLLKVQKMDQQFEELAGQIEPFMEKMAMLEKKLKMTEDLTQKLVEELERKHAAKMAEKDGAMLKKFDDLHQSYESKLADVSKQLELSKQEAEERMVRIMQQQETLKMPDEMSKKWEELMKTFREEVGQDLQKQSADTQGQLQEFNKTLQEEKTNFQRAEEGVKLWCTKFEQKGHRALEGTLHQLRDTDLQRRELYAQKDEQLAQMLEKFTLKVSTKVTELEHRMEERLKAFHTHILQDSMLKQSDQQANLMEVHKLRKEMEDRFKNLLNGGGPTSLTVGQALIEDAEGAVGGAIAMRNKFSQALSDSEQTMSKLKGKDEELASNQLEDKIHLPDISQPSSGMLGVGTGGKQSSATAQNEARSKALQPDSQAADTNKGKGQDSPPVERKQGGGNTQNRSGTSSPIFPTGPTEGNEEDDEDFTKAEEFLDWINIRGSMNGSKEMTKTISKHVKAALKEEEVPASRAKCLDTILCLDVSDSIVSAGHLDTVKQTALDFVDGVEDLMVEMDLEENVAVVALGGHARVLQHLTNDLTLVREAIDSLDDSGGRSPFMQALLVCLAANKGRGGIVSISGVHKVRPRIIFITDGYLTDESQETGPDMQSNQTQTNFCMVQLLSQLASKKHRSAPRPIDWVPIGQADLDFMKSMSELSGGELVSPENIRSRCRYYKMQQTIGRLFKMVKNTESNYLTEDKIKELMVAITADTVTQEEKDHIIKEVMRLHKSPVEEEELEPDDFDNVFEDEEKLKDGELLCLGTRVKRGPDWKWKNQDTEGCGTVVQHNKKNNWIYVKWDNGTCNAYRYNEQGKVDVQEIQHHPRLIPAESERLDFGVRVVRGPDWKWENLDGKGPGTVIRVRDSDGKLKVRWDRTGKILKYKYGPDVKEVQILSPEFPRGKGDPVKAQNPEPEDDTEKTIAMWQWRDEKRRWRLYEEHINEKLEAEYRKRPNASCVIHRHGVSHRVSFKLRQDKAVDNGSTAEVRREMVDEERKNDLLAIELSLQDC